MSIARKSALDLASRIGILVITTLTSIALNRMVGAAGRGAYVLATVVIFTQFQNLASLGVPVSNQVLVGEDRSMLGRLHSWTVILSFVAGVAGALFVWFFWRPVQGGIFRGIAPLHLILATAAIAPAFYSMAWQGLMIGLGEIPTLAGFNLAMAAVQNGAIVIVLAVFRPLSHPERLDACITLLVILFFAILAASTLVMALLLRRHGPLFGPIERSQLRRLFSFGARVYLGNFASGLLAQLDQILVNALAGLGALGVYQQAASLAGKIWMVSAGVESAAYAPMTGAKPEEARRLAAELFRVTLLVSVALIVVGWIAAPVIPLLYGKDFRATIYPFRVLLLGTAVFGCGRMFSMFFTAHRKSPETLLVLNLCLLPLHANFCLWLIPRHGLTGACWATTLTYAASMGILLVLFLRSGPRVPLRALVMPKAEDWRRVRGWIGRFFLR